jgi:hypothetical protein
MKVTLTLALLFLTLGAFAQKSALLAKESGTVRGILIVSPWRTHTAIDCFLPIEINPNKTLGQNIERVIMDTAFRVFQNTFFYDKRILRQADTLRNEAYADSIADYIKYTLVFAVEAKYNKKMQDKFNGSELDNFVSMPLTFDGRTLFEIVNTNGLLFDYKLIKLPKSNSANISFKK